MPACQCMHLVIHQTMGGLCRVHTHEESPQPLSSTICQLLVAF